MKVIIVRRSHDYMAHVDGNTAMWECGSTQAIAVGKLLVSLAERLGITIAWLPVED